MNRYLAALVFLGVFAGAGFLAFDHFERQFKNVLKVEYDKATKAHRAERTNRDAEQKALSSGAARAAQAERFLQEWSLHVNEGASGQAQIVSTLTRIASQNGLITSRQPSSVNTNYPLGGALATVTNIGFSVSGPYAQVAKWLGEVEETYLFSRIEKLNIQPAVGSSSEVELSVTIAFLQEKETK